MLRTAAPDAGQQQDLDFRLVLGQLFTLIVYAQLILEQAAFPAPATSRAQPTWTSPGGSFRSPSFRSGSGEPD